MPLRLRWDARPTHTIYRFQFGRWEPEAEKERKFCELVRIQRPLIVNDGGHQGSQFINKEALYDEGRTFGHS